ncbi:MAG: hypothetical protein ACF8TS_00975 [Maioricimonas sp. JB049]
MRSEVAGLQRQLDSLSAALVAEPQQEPHLQPVLFQQAYAPGEGATFTFADGQSRLRLAAGLETLAVFSTKRTFPRGVPLLVLPDSPFGLKTNTFSAHARQSYLNATFSGPEVAGFQTGGNVLTFFQNDNLTADDYGLLVYFAYGELKNEDWRFSAGLQQDVFNPVSPTVLYLTKLYSSGNAGSYRGQLRLERCLDVADDLDVVAQFALSDPRSFLVASDLGRLTEDNGWPNVEGRVEFGFGGKTEVRGAAVAPLRVGLSGVVGQLRTSRTGFAPPAALPPRSVIDVWGMGVDVQAGFGDRFGFAGEFFYGQGLGDYNAGVLQSFNSMTFDSVRTVGGFSEVYFYCSPTFHVHLGYGIDNPDDADLAQTQIRRNQTYYVTAIWDWSRSFQIGFEVDYRRTDYTQFQPNTFLNADAVVFGTRVLWRF